MGVVSQDALEAAQLRGGSLSFAETIGQAIANVAPTLTPTLNITIVASLAGVGTWLSFLIATAGMMAVAGNIAALARRHPVAGSHFLTIGRTLGPLAGMLAGWSLIAAYLFTNVAGVFGAVIFLDDSLAALGLARLTPPSWLFAAAFLILTWLCATRDMRLSSRLGLGLEAASLLVIVVIVAYALHRQGHLVDHAQLDLAALPGRGIMASLAFAAFCFCGFESAATLAREARDPTRSIPRAVLLTPILTGAFFVTTAYAMMLCVGDRPGTIGNSQLPFSEITSGAGIGWAAVIVYMSAAVSIFGCALACVNACARLLYSMSRYRFMPRGLGRVHAAYRTPALGIALVSLASWLIVLAFSGPAPIDAFGYTGTFATFGFLLVYLLVCLAAPIDLRRAAILHPRHALVGAAGMLLIGFVIAGSLYPVPPWPYDLLPYLFAGYLAAGVIWFLATRRRAARVGDDLEV